MRTTEVRIPKYITIKNTLIDKIENGSYLPGDAIPSDNELMRTLGVSKSTITQALKNLEAEGYIIRRQGKGSFVIDRSKSQPVLSLYLCPMEQGEEHFWTSLIDEFNHSNQGFSVKATYLSNSKAPLRDSLLQSFASGNAPDILSLDGPDVAYWAYMDSLLPFDDYMDSSFLNSFLEPILLQGSYEGRLYHLGYTESTLCILYNKELFNHLQIRIPTNTEEAWNWDEFLSICHLIKEKTSLPYPLLMDSGRGLSPKSGEWNSYSGLPFILQNRGSFFNDELTRTNGFINSPASVNAMQWLGNLFHKYHYTHIENISYSFPDNFAMSLSLPSAYFQSLKNSENVGIIPLPKGLQAATPHGSWGLCMSRQTKKPNQCCQFIQYVFTIQNQLKISKYTGIPVLKEIYEIMDNFNTIPSNTSILFSQLHHSSFTRPQTPAYPFFSKQFAYAYYNIANGMDVQKEMNHLAELVDDPLSRHNYYQTVSPFTNQLT